MIVSFRNKDTERVFNGYRTNLLPSVIFNRAYKKLWMIHTVSIVEDLRSLPSNNLEKLSGDRIGQYSIRINLQWRICFIWKEGNAYDVEIVDYH